MVVIAIIGVLSAVVVSSVDSARAKARDAQRREELNQIRAAFKMYFSDTGSYPSLSPTCLGLPTTAQCWAGYAGGTSVYGNTSLMSLLAPYMGSIPPDPLPTRTIGDAYIYATPGSVNVHCNGQDTISNGAWILWEPDAVSPLADSQCLGVGKFACCSPLGCAGTNFCALQLNG